MPSYSTCAGEGVGQFPLDNSPRTIPPRILSRTFPPGQFPQYIVHTYIYIYAYTHIYTYIHTHIHIHTYTSVCMYASVLCMYVCMYTYMYKYAKICQYI